MISNWHFFNSLGCGVHWRGRSGMVSPSPESFRQDVFTVPLSAWNPAALILARAFRYFHWVCDGFGINNNDEFLWKFWWKYCLMFGELSGYAINHIRVTHKSIVADRSSRTSGIPVRSSLLLLWILLWFLLGLQYYGLRMTAKSGIVLW